VIRQRAYPEVMEPEVMEPAKACIFCKISAGEIPASLLYEDGRVFAFADIAPQAPTHLLVVPRQHVESLGHTAREDAPLLGHLLAIGTKLAAEQGLNNGFRTVINTGHDGGQTVDHLHIHILGGRQMHWPPG
jgi:histidine triad (HIT) family protein